MANLYFEELEIGTLVIGKEASAASEGGVFAGALEAEKGTRPKN